MEWDYSLIVWSKKVTIPLGTSGFKIGEKEGEKGFISLRLQNYTPKQTK